MRLSPALRAYRVVSVLAGVFAGAWLTSRARSSKEDPARLGERFGRYRQPRPAGKLVWLHAASVGESSVALALIDALAERDPALSFLLSTGTRTSADLVVRRAGAHTAHIYAPLDRVSGVRRFLAYWRPDLGVFVESELWPNLILEAHAAGVPLALVNARLSPRSLNRWLRWRAAGEQLTRAFRFAAAADARTADALTHLRGATVANLGNLKLAAPPPTADPAARAAFAQEIGDRPVWLAASTHAGEDEIALAAHARLREATPNALLIVAPRHPERGAAVAALAGNAPRRSRFEHIGAAPVYVADTLGELGLLYQSAPVALVAGSLLPALKGHNPIEPAKLGAAILTGPNVESFQEVFQALIAARGATVVADADALASAVARLWRDLDARESQINAARGVAANGAQAFADTVDALADLLPAPQITKKPADASA